MNRRRLCLLPGDRAWQHALAFAACALLALPLRAQQAARPAPAAPASLLDHLPRVAPGHYAQALAEARARGAQGRADVVWIELFYGDAHAKTEATAELHRSTDDSPEMEFARFVLAYSRGADRAMLEAALRLTRTAPNDVASELAVRTLSGQLETQGRQLLDAVPSLEHVLAQPLTDPVTSYMLGRSLLAAVHAPGIELQQAQAQQLAGRLAHWQLWGPFGEWQNLGFDRTFPIEKQIAASYPSDAGPGTGGSGLRTPQAFTSVGNGVHFPLDWAAQGIDYAVTYLQAPKPTRVLLRMYTPASVEITINGATVLRNDRRGRYTPATATAALELAAGWNRVLVKLGGEADRSFDLMLRPAHPATGGENALATTAALPSGAHLAGAPQVLAPPPTLAQWSAQRLRQHPGDALALWVDGLRRLQDDDAEGARVALLQASKLAPEAAPVWLDLAQSDGNLNDASQSWQAAQMELAAQQALKAAPEALRAYDRLGHVYDSEGKTTEAAAQYARCAGKGYADCDWSAFHLAASHTWRPEAASALEHALAESGSNWPGIVSGLEFFTSMGNAAQAAQWERTLSADPRAAAEYGSFQLRHGHPAEAAKLFQTAISFEPSSASLRREHIEALMESGQLAAAAAAAAQDLAAFPHDWRLAAVAAEVQLRQSPQQGLQALRRNEFNRNLLRHQADFLSGDRFWMPWYHSAASIIAHTPDVSEYPNASAILVFDQMVSRINPDSTQDQYIHQIYRVLNSAGVAQFGDVTSITQGSDLITLRTIKQDGRKLLPENISNLSDVTMPGLEPGDYIEIEFVQHMAPSPVIPDTLDNSSFFVFNSSKLPYNYSDYIVLTPPGYAVAVDQERFPGEPTVKTLPDGDAAREWLVQKTRILVTEPHMPPEDTLVPKVWISSPWQWDQISRYYADHLYAVRRTTLEMRQQAADLARGQSSDTAKADAIFQWVAANVQPGPGGILDPSRQFFTDRSGNRVATFLGLLSTAKVPFQLVLARAATDISSIKIPSVYQFQYPLIHVGGVPAGAPPGAGWYDLNNDFAHLDYISPAFRGGLAIVAGATGSTAFIHVPRYTSPLDGLVVAITGSVAGSGDATLHLRMEFRGPSGEELRRELAQVPDASLPQIYQQILLSSYPNATATNGKLDNRHAKDKPLVFSIDATVPGFIQIDGAGAGSAWDIEHLASAVGVLRRYAPLAMRQEPLLINGDSFENTSMTLTLPARFGTAKLPPAAQLTTPFGSFSAQFSQHGGQINYQRTFSLNSNRIEPAQYAVFRSFAEAVDNQDRLRLTGTLGSVAGPKP